MRNSNLQAQLMILLVLMIFSTNVGDPTGMIPYDTFIVGESATINLAPLVEGDTYLTTSGDGLSVSVNNNLLTIVPDEGYSGTSSITVIGVGEDTFTKVYNVDVQPGLPVIDQITHNSHVLIDQQIVTDLTFDGYADVIISANAPLEFVEDLEYVEGTSPNPSTDGVIQSVSGNDTHVILTQIGFAKFALDEEVNAMNSPVGFGTSGFSIQADLNLTCSSNLTVDTTLTDNVLQPDRTACPGGGLRVDVDHITIDCDGFDVNGTSGHVGINITGFNNVTIRNCNINRFNSSIHLDGANDTIIDQSTFKESIVAGIDIRQAQNITVQNSIFTNTTHGIRTDTNTNSTYLNNSFYNNSDGIDLTNEEGSLIFNNTFISNTFSGVDIDINNDYISIINNSVYHSQFGINIVISDNITVNHNNIINSTSRSSISADDNVFRFNNYFQSTATLGGNTASLSRNNEVTDNIINNSDSGSTGSAVADALIARNIFINTSIGIRYTSGGGNNTITNNTLTDCSSCIEVDTANGSVISNNTIINAPGIAVRVDSRTGNVTVNNNFIKNTSTAIQSNGDDTLIENNTFLQATQAFSIGGNRVNTRSNTLINSTSGLNLFGSNAVFQNNSPISLTASSSSDHSLFIDQIITSYSITDTVLSFASSQSRLDYTSNITASGSNLSTQIITSTNLVFVNSTNNLSAAANITFFGVTDSDPDILRNGSLCPSEVCAEISFVNQTFSFNVTGFTTYTLGTVSTPSTSVPTLGGGGSNATNPRDNPNSSIWNSSSMPDFISGDLFQPTATAIAWESPREAADRLKKELALEQAPTSFENVTQEVYARRGYNMSEAEIYIETTSRGMFPVIGVWLVMLAILFLMLHNQHKQHHKRRIARHKANERKLRKL